ncbi:sacsin isoform 4-T6 [Spinachia spinachia]
MSSCTDPWLPRVTVRHEYIGLRSYRVPPFTSVEDIKELLYEETNLPVKEQRLTYNGRLLDDSVQIRTLVPAGSPEVSVALEGRGLKGGDSDRLRHR